MPKHRPITISLSPNTERDDIMLAKSLLKKPHKLTTGQGVKALEEKFKEWLPTKYAFALRTGRSALHTALLALQLQKGDEVLLQSFTCSAVPNAIIWAGGKPIYVDIDESFNMSTKNLVKRLSMKTKAIIVQHTFGTPADIDRILTIAKKRNLHVIEDCAHSLGAKYNDKHVGAFGDISIFSFGRDKVISGVAGGLLTTNNYMLSKRVEGIIQTYKKPNLLWTIRQLLHPLLMQKAIIPTYGVGSIGKIMLEALKAVGLITKVSYKAEKEGEKKNSMLGLMPNALAVLALHQMKKLNRFNAHRKKIARIYHEELKNTKNIDLPEHREDAIHLRYNIRTPIAIPILHSLRKKNIILGDWYRPTIAPHGVNYEKMQYDPDTCPNAELSSIESLNLPTHINITEKDALKIVNLIKTFKHSN